MSDQPKPYIENILGSVEAIESYRSADKSAFVADPKSQDAILMRLQDIGENLLKLRDNFPDFWESHAVDSWVKAIGLRNIISHGYAQIDIEIIWVLITEDLVAFKESVEQAI